MNRKSPLLLRADAGADIGTGHVMRCIALAQQWLATTGKPVTILSASLPDALRERVTHENINSISLQAEIGSIEDAHQTVEAALKLGAEWIVLDGYEFDVNYQSMFNSIGPKILFIDDRGVECSSAATIIVNQNIYANLKSYRSCPVDTRLLLGPRYALLRTEFNNWCSWQREARSEVMNVLVTLGGVDRSNFTKKVVVALEDYRDRRLRIKIIVGPAYGHYRNLRQITAQSFHVIEVIQSPKDVSNLMACADLIISAAGTTTLEATFMGLPSIIGEMAENQRPVAEALVEQNLAISLGRYDSLHSKTLIQAMRKFVLDYEVRRQIAENGRQLVDGYGTQRIVKHMRAASLKLRPVTWADRQLLWQWANQPSVRQASFSKEKIIWDQHINWLEEKLRDDAIRMYIGILEGKPVGVVRYSLQGDSALVSVNIDERFQGEGLGPVLITTGNAKIMDSCEVKTINAYIKNNNVASLLAFKVAGFERAGEVVIADQTAWHYRRHLISKTTRSINPAECGRIHNSPETGDVRNS